MAKQSAETLSHTIPPFFDGESKVLILGTFPSPKSREYGFFYGHPQNRFWRVLAALFAEDVPQSNEKKENLLREHHLALWDVLASCTITGASDTSIKDPVPNNLRPILAAADIQAIFTTGAKAQSLYRKYIEPEIKRPAIALPSTSPANCAMSLERLVGEYRCILDYLGEYDG